MINDAFINSELAFAAYGIYDKDQLINSLDNLAALEAAGMSETQAKQFAIRWPEIVAQYTDPITGLSATVFRNGSEVNIATRGTEGFNALDLLADLQLGVGQIPAQYTALKDFYETLKSSSLIQETDNLTVSGHSLGGFLAQILAAEFPNDFDHTYTFNSPGIGGVALDIFSISNSVPINNINNIRGDGFSTIAKVGIAWGAVEEVQIENSLFLPADHTINKLTDSLAIFNALWQLDSTFTVKAYNDTFKASSNSEKQSLESIVNNVSELFQLGINVSADDRESLHASLETISAEIHIDPSINNPQLKSHYQNLQIVGVTSLSSSAKANDADGYAYRYALVNLLPFAVTGSNTLYGQHNAGGKLDAENFSQIYLNDKAELLGLVMARNSLNITQTDITSLGVDPDFYVEDRQSRMILHGVNIPGPSAALAGSGIKRIIFGDDSSEADIVGANNDDHLYGGAGNDTINGAEGSDHIEGNTGDDQLHGDGGRDYLYGGAGADNLFGGKGDDFLSGGSGDFADNYYYDSGDGNDTIIDADLGGDRIFVNGVDLSTLNFKAVTDYANIYVANGDDTDPDNDISFIDSAGEGLIGIAGANGSGGSIALNSFDKAQIDFGINLGAAAIVSLPILEAGLHLVGDGNINVNGTATTLENLYAAREGTFQSAFNQGSLVFDAVAATSLWTYTNEYTIYFEGGDKNDELTGGDGQDVLRGKAGDDVIIGKGDDPVRGDLLEGGKGSDHIWGGDQLDNTNDGADLIWGNVSSKYVHFGAGITESDVIQGVLTGEISAAFEEEAGDASDIINGGLGDDLISGDSGDDSLFGDNGDDWLAGGKGADVIQGGEGEDSIFGDSRHENILQIIPELPDATHTFLDPIFSSELNTKYDDILLGGAGDDTVYGEIGNDVVLGEAGDDALYGDRSGLVNGEGILKIQNSPVGNGEVLVRLDGQFHGNDILYGGAGYDNIFGNGGDDILYGGTENDILFGDDSTLDDAVDLAYYGKDRLFGDEGDDILFGGGNDDYLEGGDGDDILEGDISVAGVITSAVDGAQNTVLDLQYHGDDYIDGGVGNDFIIGGAGDDQLFGGEGNDKIYGDSAYDISMVISNPSFDEAFHGHDEIHGGDGIDSVYAGAGNDIVFGDNGQDYLWGQNGDDRLSGGEGNDQLVAGEGDDILDGGKGNDLLQGDNGNDLYVFNAGDGTDSLQDTSGRITLQFNSVTDLDAVDIVQSGQNTAINYGSGDAVVMDNATFNHVTHLQLAGGLSVNRYEFIGRLTSNVISADSQISVQTQSPDSNVNVNYQGVDDDLLLSVSETDANGQTPLQKTFVIGGGIAGAIIFIDVNGELSTPELASELIIKNWWLAPSNQRANSLVINEVVQPIQTYDIPRTIFGGAGNDEIYGGNADDELHGGDGNDTIWGGDGMDTIYGDRGNDTLIGNLGTDTYWFSAGDGVDVIGHNSASGTTASDLIRFDESVAPADVALSVDLVDLLIDYNGGNDQIRVNAYFAGDDFQIDAIQFADGTVWDEGYIRGATGIAETDLWFQGEATNYAYGETPEGFNYVITNDNDGAITYLDGGVFGNFGDQIIVSGGGSKTPDVYHFNSGRLDGFLGSDSIYAGGGDDEVVGGPGNSAAAEFFTFDPLGGYFYSLPYGMSFHNLKGLPLPFPEGVPEDDDNQLWGEGGDDLIRSGSGVDTIDGGHGNDHLYGNFNSDIYRFNRGYGQDIIFDAFHSADTSPLDVIEFGQGVTPDDVVVQQINIAAYYDTETSTFHDSREEVRFAIKNTRDSISINVSGSTLSSELLEVSFANGDSWSSGDLQNRIVSDELYANSIVNVVVNNEIIGTNGAERLEAGSGDETLIGLGGNDGLYGFEGIDQLFGGAGNDQLIGGAGNDWLEGGSGNDYLIGGNDNDTYLFSAGFGNDIIDNYDDTATATNQIGGMSIDAIQFQSGIASSEVSLSRDGDNLVVSHNTDQVTVKNHFFGEDLGFNERYALDEIRFTDEPSVLWDNATINTIIEEFNLGEPPIPVDNIPPFWERGFPGRERWSRFNRRDQVISDRLRFVRRLASNVDYSTANRPLFNNGLNNRSEIVEGLFNGNQLFFANQLDKLVQAMAASGAGEASDLSIYTASQEELSISIAASFQSA